jgi:hypothetical protein
VTQVFAFPSHPAVRPQSQGLRFSPRLGGRQRSGTARSLAESIQSVDTDAGRGRVRAYLDSRPFPHFEPCQDEAGMLVRIDEDGTRTRGRFINCTFVAAK